MSLIDSGTDPGIDLVRCDTTAGCGPGWGAARLGRLFLERFTRGMRLTRAGWVSDTSLQGRSAQTAEEKTDFLSLWRHHEKETVFSLLGCIIGDRTHRDGCHGVGSFYPDSSKLYQNFLIVEVEKIKSGGNFWKPWKELVLKALHPL